MNARPCELPKAGFRLPLRTLNDRHRSPAPSTRHTTSSIAISFRRSCWTLPCRRRASTSTSRPTSARSALAWRASSNVPQVLLHDEAAIVDCVRASLLDMFAAQCGSFDVQRLPMRLFGCSTGAASSQPPAMPRVASQDQPRIEPPTPADKPHPSFAARECDALADPLGAELRQ